MFVRQTTWICSTCTLINMEGILRCDMCLRRRWTDGMTVSRVKKKLEIMKILVRMPMGPEPVSFTPYINYAIIAENNLLIECLLGRGVRLPVDEFLKNFERRLRYYRESNKYIPKKQQYYETEQLLYRHMVRVKLPQMLADLCVSYLPRWS
jgi:hypothetical protein